MKKLTAMLLSLMMCLSLMAIPAQAAFIPDPDGPGIIDVGKIPTNPDGDDPDEPGEPGGSAGTMRLPEPAGDPPRD